MLIGEWWGAGANEDGGGDEDGVRSRSSGEQGQEDKVARKVLEEGARAGAVEVCIGYLGTPYTGQGGGGTSSASGWHGGGGEVRENRACEGRVG